MLTLYDAKLQWRNTFCFLFEVLVFTWCRFRIFPKVPVNLEYEQSHVYSPLHRRHIWRHTWSDCCFQTQCFRSMCTSGRLQMLRIVTNSSFRSARWRWSWNRRGGDQWSRRWKKPGLLLAHISWWWDHGGNTYHAALGTSAELRLTTCTCQSVPGQDTCHCCRRSGGLTSPSSPGGPRQGQMTLRQNIFFLFTVKNTMLLLLQRTILTGLCFRRIFRTNVVFAVM